MQLIVKFLRSYTKEPLISYICPHRQDIKTEDLKAAL
jgi:hypothetical protein